MGEPALRQAKPPEALAERQGESSDAGLRRQPEALERAGSAAAGMIFNSQDHQT